jgi:hypothetical protein
VSDKKVLVHVEECRKSQAEPAKIEDPVQREEGYNNAENED